MDTSDIFILNGFLIGLFGSLHCVGMCGPLALALPLGQKTKTGKIMGGLAYNLGRSFTYAILGLIFGLIGAGLKLSGVQQWVSIACGIIMVLSVVLPGLIKAPSAPAKVIGRLVAPLKNKLGSLLKQNKIHHLFLFGLLNGFLPCGLVYIAIAGAVAGSSLVESILFMFLFGLGTLPMMFAVVYFGNMMKSHLLNRLKRLIPVFVIIIGLLFIVRGLNLGIPYLSPKFTEPQKAECCH
jgi:sulfite exporter TauE/SafE